MITEKTLKKFILAEQDYINNKITLREVCKKFKIDRHTFSNYLKSKNISTKRKVYYNENIFSKIDTEEKAYWLGFLYADGSIYCNIYKKRYRLELSLAEKDLNHLNKFKDFLKIPLNIKYRKNQKAFRISFGNKKMCEDLIKLGCTPRKSLTLKFPNEKQVPKELINHFIRGYFDGDGHLGITKNNSPKSSLLGTKEFLEEILIKLNFNMFLQKDKRHLNNTYYLRFRVNEIISIINFMYGNSTIHLERKYNLYLYIMNNCRSGKKFSELLESKNGED